MSKITLTNLANLQNENTAVNDINSNNATITTAFDNTLSRDGTAPNTMGSNLDMNNNQILNLPTPATVNSPARLIDVVSNPTLSVPPTGTSGHTVPFLDGNNTWSGTNAFAAISSSGITTPAIVLNGTTLNSVIGTGAVVLSASPTLTGTLQVPTIAGGSTASSVLTIQSTTSVGTTDAIVFQTATQTERARITTAGRLGINTAVPQARLHVNANASTNPTNAGSHLLMITGADTVSQGIQLDCFGTGAIPQIIFRVARGTGASPSAVQSGDILFNEGMYGFDGTAYQQATAVQGLANETFSTGHHGGHLLFYTTPAGGSITESMRINGSGGVGVGTTTDPGVGALLATDVYTNNATFLVRTKTALTNSAAAQTATLTNAPTAGNPTKWFAIDDNGTSRKIPAW